MSVKVQVISAQNVEDGLFGRVSTPSSFDYVATKLLWSPTSIKGNDFLAISGDGLNLWRWDATANSLDLVTKLISRSNPRRSIVEAHPSPNGVEGRNPPAPLPSFDWSPVEHGLIVAASYDTTCTVWDINTCSIKTQLIAHDKEVFDVAFSPRSADTFVSVGADGSLRLFDIRSLDHSTIIYETPDVRPLLRVAWNPLDANYLACFGSDSSSVILMDVRMPSIPAAELADHDGPVLACRWSPASPNHLITGDGEALRLWDLQVTSAAGAFTPAWTLDGAAITGSEAFEPIQQIIWPRSQPEWLAVSTADCIYTFQI